MKTEHKVEIERQVVELLEQLGETFGDAAAADAAAVGRAQAQIIEILVALFDTKEAES